MSRLAGIGDWTPELSRILLHGTVAEQAAAGFAGLYDDDDPAPALRAGG